jgi:hypothetical protein
MNQRNNRLSYYLIIGSIGLIWFAIPIHVDVILSLFNGHQIMSYNGSLLESLLNSWNLRGIGYKSIMLLVIKSSDYIGVNNEYAYKVLYIFISGILFLFSWSIKTSFYRVFSIDKKKYFFWYIAAFLMVSNWMNMQPGHLAVLLSLPLSLVIFSREYISIFFTGLILTFMFALKGVTILFGGSVLVFLLLDYSRKRVISAIISVLIWTFLSFVFYRFYATQEIVDLIAATSFQRSAEIDINFFVHLISNWLRAISHSIFLVLLPLILFKARGKYLLFLVASLLICTFYVVIQSKYFAYHYLIFIPTIVYYLAKYVHGKRNIQVISVLYGLYLLLTITPSGVQVDLPHARRLILKDASACHKYAREDYAFFESAGSIFQDNINSYGDDTLMLYLSDGGINLFMKDIPSVSRYFYPLPIQRGLHEGIKSDAYIKAKDQILENRDIEYVLIQNDWFKIDLDDDLNYWLNECYKRVDSARNERIALTLYKKK